MSEDLGGPAAGDNTGSQTLRAPTPPDTSSQSIVLSKSLPPKQDE
eukprot:CAMPEP_0195011744 /NCGR_PEP_ID=MMETSP0326_2-20130528/11231_1 /TAXON_ID=2866 ORGANISM="Crypthecodinium cohnii, Strain Seligo" /NCGR_SAMPLE_ID=MMETSP0326_2 /ASSEMBLY_ACC=CAM_ASM_000348 /LENGTH=44 /DNA_ID= /DNA_START= /DNA_END= /DNA_ORIENTATION=